MCYSGFGGGCPPWVIFLSGNIFFLSAVQILECGYRGCKGIIDDHPLCSVCRRASDDMTKKKTPLY